MGSSGFGGWIKDNPALAQGLLTSAVAGATGQTTALEAFGLGGQAYGQQQSNIAAQQAAAYERQMELSKLGLEGQKVGIEGAKTRADILNMQGQLSLAQDKNSMERAKQTIETITAANKLGMNPEKSVLFTAQIQAGHMPNVQEKNVLAGRLGTGIGGSGIFGRTTQVAPIGLSPSGYANSRGSSGSF